MSRITINSNIASLGAQRQFAKSSDKVTQSFERLSSGLRINRARDDAAGLAISSALNVDARIYAQGIRNINDSSSLLSIAEGANEELSNVLLRLRELATQSANGTLSNDQRDALDEEADALVNEYNRIVRTTSFNNLQLLDPDTGPLRAQGGYGESGGIEFSLATELAQNVGDGEFTENASLTIAGLTSRTLKSADINADGNLDVFGIFGGTPEIQVALGRGDGSFEALVTTAISGNYGLSELTDYNNDGVLDVVLNEQTAGGLLVMLGNEDGSFVEGESYAAGTSTQETAVGDFDGDGNSDIAAVDAGTFDVFVYYGDGDGTFSRGRTFSKSGVSTTLTVGDVNEDGLDDILAGTNTLSQTSLALSQGVAGFQTETIIPTSGGFFANMTDLNDDGHLDVIASNVSTDSIYIGLGDGKGNFIESSPYAVGDEVRELKVVDINGDGIKDLVGGDGSEDRIYTLLGNGDGSFKSAGVLSTINSLVNKDNFAMGDFNSDGVQDILVSNTSTNQVFLGEVVTQSELGAINLNNKEEALAAFQIIDSALERVARERGAIGAAQSRLSVASANLAVARENSVVAASRIRDLDVARESANLVKNSIVQQAGAAVMGQANQLPELALRLLSG